VAYVPLVLYLMGAIFLALTVLFVLEAKVVRPASRRDEPGPWSPARRRQSLESRLSPIAATMPSSPRLGLNGHDLQNSRFR
jgi:hypothetical protein